MSSQQSRYPPEDESNDQQDAPFKMTHDGLVNIFRNLHLERSGEAVPTQPNVYILGTQNPPSSLQAFTLNNDHESDNVASALVSNAGDSNDNGNSTSSGYAFDPASTILSPRDQEDSLPFFDFGHEDDDPEFEEEYEPTEQAQPTRTLDDVQARFNPGPVESLTELDAEAPYSREAQRKLQQLGDDQCHVCWLEYTEPVTTTCGHIFCKNCVLRAMVSKMKCPLCARVQYVENLVTIDLEEEIESDEDSDDESDENGESDDGDDERKDNGDKDNEGISTMDEGRRSE